MHTGHRCPTAALLVFSRLWGPATVHNSPRTMTARESQRTTTPW